MSRTLRRNKPHLFRQYLGTRSDEMRDPWYLMYRYPTCTFDQVYDRARARFYRDSNSGRYSAPRFYRRFLGSKKIRLRETAALHHALRNDTWDAHLPENRARDADWCWF